MGKRALGYFFMIGPAVHSIMKVAGIGPPMSDTGYGWGSFVGGWVGSVLGVLFGLAIVLSADE